MKSFDLLITGSVEDHGCWKAIQREENFVTLESIDGRTKEKYKERNDSLLKCAEAAITNQYTLFALRDGGQCLAGSQESTAYKKHGVSKLCANGLGSSSSKNIYQIIGRPMLSYFIVIYDLMLVKFLNGAHYSIIRYNPAILGTEQQKPIPDTKYKETSACNKTTFTTAPLQTQLSPVSHIYTRSSSWTLHSPGRSKQYG
jgi:hypothetical protein